MPLLFNPIKIEPKQKSSKIAFYVDGTDPERRGSIFNDTIQLYFVESDEALNIPIKILAKVNHNILKP